MPIRGGTDGAMLSFKGLPCPNLGTGGFNCHGPLECATVEKLDQMVEVLLHIVELYRQKAVSARPAGGAAARQKQ